MLFGVNTIMSGPVIHRHNLPFTEPHLLLVPVVGCEISEQDFGFRGLLSRQLCVI